MIENKIKKRPMQFEDLKKQISKLETINDQLQAELHSLDELLKTIGFDEGIATLKSAAHELMKMEHGGEEPNS